MALQQFVSKQKLSSSQMNAMVTEINGKVDKVSIATSLPSDNAILPDTMYQIGTLTSDMSFTLADAPDDGKAHVYAVQFALGSTVYTITPPSGLAWVGGEAPTFAANKSYEISIMNNLAVCAEAAVTNN